MTSFFLEPFDNELSFPVATFAIAQDEACILFAPEAALLHRLGEGGSAVVRGRDVPTLLNYLSPVIGFEPLFIGIRRKPVDDVIAPYLFHTDYELPLILNGTKKFGWFHLHPNLSDFERFRFDCFERKINDGLVCKQEWLFEDDRGTHGQVFFTPPGEGWRLQAYELMKRIFGTFVEAGEAFEEMLGELMGYSHEENLWWREDCLRRGVFPNGLRLYFAVTADDCLFIRNSGNRALPWDLRGTYRMFGGYQPTSAFFTKLLSEACDCTAVARITVPLRDFSLVANQTGIDSYEVRGENVPQVNGLLKGIVAIVYKDS